jgi:transposase
MMGQGISAGNMVIVLDNAPCHSKAEVVMAEYPGASLLRLAPYSPMLNPIESAWSAIKSQMKRKEAESINELLAGNLNNNGLTQTEWRLRYVESLIDEARNTVTPLMCMKFVNHTQTYYADALSLKDMPVGM